MDELIEVLKALSKDMKTGDMALFGLCEKIIERLTAQEAHITGLLENQKLINEVLTVMSKSMEVQRDTIKTHTNTMKVMRETLEAYTKRMVN